MARRYLVLTSELAKQVAAVPITNGMYRPSQVVLDDGSTLDRVYMVEAAAFVRSWGGNADDEGTGRTFIPVQKIAAIANSPSRLPPKAADKLYASGESAMALRSSPSIFAMAAGWPWCLAMPSTSSTTPPGNRRIPLSMFFRMPVVTPPREGSSRLRMVPLRRRLGG